MTNTRLNMIISFIDPDPTEFIANVDHMYSVDTSTIAVDFVLSPKIYLATISIKLIKKKKINTNITVN